MKREVWRAVPGYEGKYEVSSRGRLRALARKADGRDWLVPARDLKLTQHKHGYLHCGLSKNGYQQYHLVHRLVAAAFLSPTPNSTEVNHKDGDKKNNRLDNLEWVTGSENQKHSYKLGLRKPMRGSLHKRAILTEEQVRWIHAWSREGFSQSTIGAAFEIGQSHVSGIVRGKYWPHMKGCVA